MMKNLKRAVSILLTFMMLFGTFGAMSVGAGAVTNTEKQIYISDSGDDTNGDGTNEKPYKTINKAIGDLSSTGGKIILEGDVTISSNTYTCSTHSMPITITSAPKMEAKLVLNKNIKLGGPMTFENINIETDKKTDGVNYNERYIYANGNPLLMGEGINTIGLLNISGGKGGSNGTNINVEIKSGKYYRVYAVDVYGGTFSGNVNLAIGGSTVVSDGLYIGGSINASVDSSVTGTTNVNVNNGSINNIYIGAANGKTSTFEGNVTIDINGGAISGMIGTKSGATGTTAYKDDAKCYIDFSNFKQTFAHESYAYENWEAAVASLNDKEDYKITKRNDDLAVFAGYQVSLTEKVEGYYNIRFLSVLQGDKHTKAGYNITARYSDKSKTFTAPATAVYTSIVASTATGEMVNVKASDLGGDYILALTITDIPEAVGAVEFEVTPYTNSGAGETVTFTHDPEKQQNGVIINDVFKGAESKITSIMGQGNQYENASPTDNGQKYYVSTNEASNSSAEKGTKENPFTTIDEVNNAAILECSIVLFERGCEWRMNSYTQSDDAAFLMLKTGVKYSSYGDTTKPKPIINGSPVDAGGASNATKWTETTTKNVWVYEKQYYGMKDYGDINGYLMDDIGNVIFNDGAVYGER